jgi:Xaa-Pro aminopeptidase
MASSHAGRFAQLRQLLAEKSCDSMVTMHMFNIRYLCGFTGSAGVLVVTPDDATLYVDGRYPEQAARETRVAKPVEAPWPVLPYAINQVKSKLGRVGFEAQHVTFAEYQELAALLPDGKLLGLQGLVETLRAVKDEDELAAIRKACDLCDKVFDSFCGWIKPGMVEQQVEARLTYEQCMLGSLRNASGVLVVSSGPRTALPHGLATDKVIGHNEPVMIDLGGVVDGYCSDLTRTVYLGKAPDEFVKLYQVVFDAQQRALDCIKPGMTGIEADALARDVIEAAGYGDRFRHSLGHSVGLDVHERPSLSSRDSTVLRENMVFTVEPGVYLPGWGGVRIEEQVRVTADGLEILSKSNRRLVEI